MLLRNIGGIAGQGAGLLAGGVAQGAGAGLGVAAVEKWTGGDDESSESQQSQPEIPAQSGTVCGITEADVQSMLASCQGCGFDIATCSITKG